MNHLFYIIRFIHYLYLPIGQIFHAKKLKINNDLCFFKVCLSEIKISEFRGKYNHYS